MGLIDGLIGGAVGAEVATAVNTLIEKHGGVQGIVAQFQKQGLGATVQSWISPGPNQSITPDQVHQVFGADTITNLAAKLGVSPQELATKLSTVLPQAVDKLTPGGVVPKAN
jgi:uncharacterized protein YidB (DUF937 family)